jgi:hypothetical protein
LNGARLARTCLVAPGAATIDRVRASLFVYPCCAVGVSIFIVAMPVIFDPLPDVAQHIGQTEGVEVLPGSAGVDLVYGVRQATASLTEPCVIGQLPLIDRDPLPAL